MDEYKNIVQACNQCDKCSFHADRSSAIVGRTLWSGDSNLNAPIMIIGEAPGFNEDKLGIPFVGAAGKYMQAGLDKLGLSRKVYITNILKCRPPKNRDPSDKEKENCAPYLKRQIELIRPYIIISIGRHAFTELVPDHNLRITREEGKIFHYRMEDESVIPVIPMLHSAYMLRQKGSATYPELRESHWKNWTKIRDLCLTMENN